VKSKGKKGPPGIRSVIFDQIPSGDILRGIDVLPHGEADIALKARPIDRRKFTEERQSPTGEPCIFVIFR
jgi:hypothetical protein